MKSFNEYMKEYREQIEKETHNFIKDVISLL